MKLGDQLHADKGFCRGRGTIGLRRQTAKQLLIVEIILGKLFINILSTFCLDFRKFDSIVRCTLQNKMLLSLCIIRLLRWCLCSIIKHFPRYLLQTRGNAVGSDISPSRASSFARLTLATIPVSA